MAQESYIEGEILVGQWLQAIISPRLVAKNACGLQTSKKKIKIKKRGGLILSLCFSS